MCDYDPPAVWGVIERKARRDHKCAECFNGISKGDQYEYYSALYDGAWFNSKTCKSCVALREAFRDMNDCFGVGELYSELVEDATRSNLHKSEEGWEKIKELAPDHLWEKMKASNLKWIRTYFPSWEEVS